MVLEKYSNLCLLDSSGEVEKKDTCGGNRIMRLLMVVEGLTFYLRFAHVLVQA